MASERLSRGLWAMGGMYIIYYDGAWPMLGVASRHSISTFLSSAVVLLYL